MEKPKEVTNDKIKVFRFNISSVLKAVLEITNFLSVAASFWIVSWLLYFTIVKDTFDIILYAADKYIERFKWFFRITGANNLFKDLTSDFEERTEISENPLDKIDCEEAYEVFECSPAVINVTRNDDDNFQHLSNSSHMTPHNPVSKFASPRRIIMNSDSNCKKDIAYVSPVQQSYLRQKIFSWGFDKRRVSESFQNEKHSVLSSSKFNKVIEVQEKVKEILPIPCEDKEKLITADESPEYVGCCGNIFTFLKHKFEVNQNVACSMHYKRF